jgi:hypothetical protein
METTEIPTVPCLLTLRYFPDAPAAAENGGGLWTNESASQPATGVTFGVKPFVFGVTSGVCLELYPENILSPSPSVKRTHCHLLCLAKNTSFVTSSHGFRASSCCKSSPPPPLIPLDSVPTPPPAPIDLLWQDSIAALRATLGG